MLFVDALRRVSQHSELAALANLDPNYDAIPDDFLDYVAPGQPGEAFLDAGQMIDQYLYSGEAARESGSLGLTFSSVFQTLGKIRDEVGSDRFTNSPMPAKAIHELIRQIGNSEREISSLPSRKNETQTAHTINSIQSDFQKLRKLLEDLRGASNRDIVESTQEMANGLVTRLRSNLRTIALS